MAPSRPARPTATRGTLSARQWQDIHNAALVSRATGVTLVTHGVKSIGDKPPANAGNPRAQVARGSAVREPDGAQQRDTGAAPAGAAKKKQRDLRRAQANRANKAVARWQSLAKRLKYDHVVMPVWTHFMRSRMSPKRDARRKLRDVLWREWTRRQFDAAESSTAPLGTRSPLGLLSHRDRYILRRADALMLHVFPDEPVDADMAAALVDEEYDLQEAIAASLMTTPSVTQGDDHNTSAATRSLTDAGISTPGSARRAGKRRSGRRP